VKRRTLHIPHPFAEINATPLIDVVMCLIVFFLIVGKLAADQRRALDLPRSATGISEPASATEQVNIDVFPAAAAGPPQVAIDGQTTPRAALEQTLRDHLSRLGNSSAGIANIRGARNLSYAAIAPVISACKAAGFASIRLATEKTP
jgi:biopolymer transport protein ExbD